MKLSMNKTNNESTLLSDTLLNQVSFRIAENMFGTTNFVVNAWVAVYRRKVWLAVCRDSVTSDLSLKAWLVQEREKRE